MTTEMPNHSTEIPLEKTSKRSVPKVDLELPSIDDLPDSDVVIFDGQCNFCRGQVRNLHRWSGNRLAFISLHDARVPERFPELTHEMLMQQMYVVTQSGESYAGAAAVRYLSRKLPWLWILCPVLHIPFSLPLWQWGYDQIARRRYRIAGKNESCENGSCEVHFRS